MILLALLVVCIATVPLTGGRLARLAELTFRRPAAGVAALLVQLLVMGLFPEGNDALHRGAHLASYALLFYFVAGNLWMPGLWLIAIGGGLNALVIAANDGVMPADPDAMAVAGLAATPGEFANSTVVADAKLWFLGDIFALPAQWPLANVFSVGDIVLMAGAFVLLHRQSESALAAHMAALGLRVRRLIPGSDLVRENRTFRRLWLAQAISGIGDWIYPLAVFTYVVDDDTHAASLAFLLIAQFGPGLLVGVFGGPLIDRFSRKWILFSTDIARGLAVGTLLLAGDPSLTHLYAVAALIGVCGSFNQPAFLASLPNIVPVRHLARANALVGLTMGIAITVGPAVGAIIVEEFGIVWGFSANAISFLFAAALVFGTKMPRRVAPARLAFAREMVQGLRFVAGHRHVLSVVAVIALITIGAGIKSPLEPLFALRSLDAGTAGLGWMGAVWGVGMLVGGLLASRADARLGHGPLLTVSVLVVGVTVVLSAYSPTLGPVLLLWAIAGIANTTGTVAYETLLQEQTPDEVRGRVFAAVEAALQAGQLLGVGLAAFSEVVFPEHMAARHGIFVSGLLFAVAAAVSQRLLHGRAARRRRAAQGPPLVLREVAVVDAGPSLALLRVATVEAPGAVPVLLVDDGRRVHRLQALPGHTGRSFGYGVPRGMLRRAALAIELPLGRLDLPPLRA